MLQLLFLVLPLVVESAPASTDPLPLDCDDIYTRGSLATGVYTIYPASPDRPVQVFCDMGSEEDSGRWTVFQRRMDGSVNFYRPWDEYKNGFGNASTEYWLGLKNLYQLTNKRKYELRVDLQDFEGGKVYARYIYFSVEAEANGYKLHVSGFMNGGAGDALQIHDGQMFSTFDKDQDTWGGNCAKSHLGGFWYAACHHANPNGIYLWGKDPTLNAIGNVWYQWKGTDYGLKFISMKIRPVCENFW